MEQIVNKVGITFNPQFIKNRYYSKLAYLTFSTYQFKCFQVIQLYVIFK